LSTRSTSEKGGNECVVCVVCRESTSSREQEQKAEMKKKQEENEMWSVSLWLKRSDMARSSSLCPFVCLRLVVKEPSPLSSLQSPFDPLFQLENTKRVSSLPRDQPSPSIIINPRDARSPSFGHLIPSRIVCPDETPPPHS
jgi:hypothetical protein